MEIKNGQSTRRHILHPHLKSDLLKGSLKCWWQQVKLTRDELIECTRKNRNPKCYDKWLSLNFCTKITKLKIKTLKIVVIRVMGCPTFRTRVLIKSQIKAQIEKIITGQIILKI